MGDKNTNWQDLIFRTAISHDHNVSVTGNINDRMPYRASVGYTGQQGTLETSKYERGTLDLSLSPNFFDKHLTVNMNAKGVVTSQRYASSGVVGSAAFFNPTIDPYWRNEDGSIDYTTTNGFWNYGSGRGEEFTPNTLLGAGPPRSSTTATTRHAPSDSSATPRSTTRCTASRPCASTSTSVWTSPRRRPTTA